MLFSHPIFLFLFLPVLLVLHRLAPKALRNSLLLAASLLFYASGESEFVAVMVASILANYGFGIWLGPKQGERASARHRVVTLAVVFNLGLLFSFKYVEWLWGLAVDGLAALGVDGLLGPPPDIHLPIGISFFTFQAISYIVDVYRGHEPPQRNLVRFALYISLFPQLIAGPIVRYGTLAGQLAHRAITRPDFAEGCRRFLGGLAKKVLIADVLVAPATIAFAHDPAALTLGTAWATAIAYTLYVYFDFSGYSDMAIGLGRMFGFRIPENFIYPYVARSITDFWTRWHVSLSSWFRDYVYIPLGGNRLGATRTYVNLWLVFLLCGTWHGASGNFVLWGAIHGFFLVVERALAPRVRWRPPAILGWAYTMLIVMCSFTLVGAGTVGRAWDFCSRLFAAPALSETTESLPVIFDRLERITLAVGIVICIPIYPAYLRWRGRREQAGVGLRSGYVLDVAESFGWAGVLVATWLTLSVSTFSPFLYFRF